MQENDQKETTNKILASIQSHLTDSEEIQNILEQTDRHASNYHTYCGIKRWNAEIERCEDKVSSLQKDLQLFDQFDVEINQRLTDILTEIKNFASIETKYTRPVAKLLRKEKQGQQSLANTEVNTDITLSNARVFTIPSGKEALLICGCCIMESESMVFTDYYNERLVHLDKEGKLFNIVELSFQPLDVVKVDNDNVAVTSKNDQKLVLVDIKQGRVVRTVYEGEECYGLSYNDGNFIVSVGNKIKVFDLDGKVLSTIDVENNATMCCVENGILYYTASATDTVYCCDMAGNVKWKYTCIKGDYPQGITLDNKGDVLVACQDGNKVIEIDKDGNRFKVLLTDKDGMNKPKSTSYSKKYNVLLVANWVEGKCFIYNLT